jgi:hypothetical protein
MDFKYQLIYADQLLQGLLADLLEDDKAFDWIVLAADLIRGLRPSDLIYEFMNAGIVLDSILIGKVLFLDQMVNAAAAEIIQTLVHYRAHSSQKNRVIDCIISGKSYEGPIYSESVRQAKNDSNYQVKKTLLDLIKISQAAIEIVAREMA